MNKQQELLMAARMALEWIEEAKRTGTSLPATNTIEMLKSAIMANSNG